MRSSTATRELATDLHGTGKSIPKLSSSAALATNLHTSEKAVGCIEDIFWGNLCRILNINPIGQKKGYATTVDRIQRADEKKSMLSSHFLKRTISDWLDLFKNEDIPCTPVNFLDELEQDPHIKHRAMINNIDEFNLINFPVKFNGEREDKLKLPGAVGEESEAILRKLGYTSAEINDIL